MTYQLDNPHEQPLVRSTEESLQLGPVQTEELRADKMSIVLATKFWGDLLYTKI